MNHYRDDDQKVKKMLKKKKGLWKILWINLMNIFEQSIIVLLCLNLKISVRVPTIKHYALCIIQHHVQILMKTHKKFQKLFLSKRT